MLAGDGIFLVLSVVNLATPIFTVVAHFGVPRMLPRHQGCTRRCRDGTAAVCLRETHAFLGHTVKTRRGDIRLPVACQIAIAHIITKDEDNVRLGLLACHRCKGNQRKSSKNQFSTAFHRKRGMLMLIVSRNSRTKVEKKKECHKFFTKNSTHQLRRRGQKEASHGCMAPRRPPQPLAREHGRQPPLPAKLCRLAAGVCRPKNAAASRLPQPGRQESHRRPTPRRPQAEVAGTRCCATTLNIL